MAQPEAPKRYWTDAKILVLVLLAFLGAAGFGYALNHQINRAAPTSGSSNTCSNGGTNYPATNPPTCTMFNPCPNGGTNPPACNVFPTLQCRGTAACFKDSVTYIVDGDTLDVGTTRIRLALVNTPEVGEPGYVEAKRFTAQTCPVGIQAAVDEDDGQTGGSYGRMIAVVYCQGVNLNEALLGSGHAVLLTYYCPVSEFADEAWTGCS